MWQGPWALVLGRGIYKESEGSVASSLRCIILAGCLLMVCFLVCRIIGGNQEKGDLVQREKQL